MTFQRVNLICCAGIRRCNCMRLPESVTVETCSLNPLAKFSSSVTTLRNIKRPVLSTDSSVFTPHHLPNNLAFGPQPKINGVIFCNCYQQKVCAWCT